MSKKIYLPGLNGIRAIAASAVIVSHIGLSFDKFGLEKLGGYDLASFGVTLFFTLSGFLITYLLLKEKEVKLDIDIKKFYVRRILRIWPLYFFYLAIVICYIKFDVNSDLLYYIFIAPNVPFAINAAAGGVLYIPYIAHYWSLGVEEQFYAFWPWIVKKAKRLLLFLTLFAISFFLLKIVLSVTNSLKTVQVFLHYTRFGCLAIGGIGAYFFHYHADKIKFLNHRIFEISAWLVLVLVAFNKFHIFSIIDHEIISFVALTIIFNQINNPKPLFSLENKLFDYLGKISFGLYVYNPLVIAILASFMGASDMLPWLYKVIIYFIAFFSVVLVSHLSYFGFEKRFLTIKDKYTTIPSAASNPNNE